MMNATYCAHDVIDYLMQSVGGGAQDQEHRVLRAATHHSYRDVSNAKDWLWYVTESKIVIEKDENSYLLPEDCSNVDALVAPDRTTITSYISPAEWMRLEQSTLTLGEPAYWTVMKSNDPLEFNRWQIRIAGQLPEGTELRFTYRRRPKPLQIMGFETQARTGFVDVSGTAATGKNTNFPARCAGSMIRIGTPSNYPEPMSGFYAYQAQVRIADRTSETALVLDSAIGDFTACRFVISDILDVSPNMFTAILTGAEMWLARLQGKNVEGAVQMYTRDLRMAIEQDVVAPISGRRAPYDRIPDNSGVQYAGNYAPMGPDGGAG
jgi:hypothetical protein